MIVKRLLNERLLKHSYRIVIRLLNNCWSIV